MRSLYLTAGRSNGRRSSVRRLRLQKQGTRKDEVHGITHRRTVPQPLEQLIRLHLAGRSDEIYDSCMFGKLILKGYVLLLQIAEARLSDAKFILALCLLASAR